MSAAPKKDWAAISAEVAEMRAAQGLPPTISDPAILNRVAAILLLPTNGCTETREPLPDLKPVTQRRISADRHAAGPLDLFEHEP